MENPKSNYWPQLDGLRTIAFLLVFYHHHGAPAEVPEPWKSVVTKVAEWGWLGVDLFFVLSAFLVTHLLCTERKMYGEISLAKFYARRALRIWPLYFVVLTVTCFIYPLFAPHKASHLYSAFLQHIVAPLYCFTGNFALPWNFGIIDQYAKASGLEFFVFVTILGPFWSLCIEEQFYLLWGMGARLANTMRKLIVIAVALLVVGFLARFALLSYARESVASTCYYMNSFWHVDTIMLGALLAMTFIAKPEWAQRLQKGWLPIALFIGSTTTFFGVVLYGPSIHSWNYALAPLMTLVSLAGVVFLALALNWRPLGKLLSVKWMMQVGKLTFGMYVFHFFICWLAKNSLPLGIIGWHGVWSLTVCFALTLVAALVSWKVLEKPMNDMRRKLSRVHVEEPDRQTVPAAAMEAGAQHQHGDKSLAVR